MPKLPVDWSRPSYEHYPGVSIVSSVSVSIATRQLANCRIDPLHPTSRFLIENGTAGVALITVLTASRGRAAHKARRSKESRRRIDRCTFRCGHTDHRQDLVIHWIDPDSVYQNSRQGRVGNSILQLQSIKP
jgi:hypothetical protein